LAEVVRLAFPGTGDVTGGDIVSVAVMTAGVFALARSPLEAARS
jgi:hypothetical protein